MFIQKLKKVLTLSLVLIMIMTSLSMAVSANEESFVSGDWYYIINDGKATIVRYNALGDDNVTIPSVINGYPVIKIGNKAFLNRNDIINVSIPNNVMTIGESAFAGCINLANIDIPNGITNIDKFAFESSGLTNIIIPGSVNFIGVGAFFNCTNLLNVLILDGVGGIASFAFSGCYNLTDITLPKKMKGIDPNAFDGCINLNNIVIPNEIEHIGPDVFQKTPWYNNQPDGVIYIGKIAYSYKGKMSKKTSITLKKGTKMIGHFAFSKCKNLSNIKIPNSVTFIGSYAFMQCTNLFNVTIPKNVKYIGDKALGYDNLGKIKLKISCYKNSTAHLYAEKEFISFALKVESIIFNKTFLKIKKGKKLQLSAIIIPFDAFNKNVTWKTSNSKIVFVNNNGKVTAKKKGNATITVTTKDGKKTCKCKITIK